MDFHKLYARFNESKQYKDRWLALYKNLYYYVIPDRDAFNVKWNYRDDGKPVTVQIWDNTAMIAAYQRANDLHALLLPKDRVWGKMVLDPHLFEPAAIEQAQPVVDEVNERVLFYLNQSNLARIVSSSNLDLVGGTGAVWVESIDDNTPLYFRSIPAVALYIEYSTDDVLNTCWYQCKMTGRQVMETFPKYRGRGLQALMGSPDEIYIVLYGQIKLSEEKFYLYATLEIDPFTPCWETERNYNQIIIYRDRVRPGEADGRGIGIDMLPTIQDLNRIVQYDRQAQAFKANPPMFYDSDAYFNPYSVRQWAGAMIQRRAGGRNPLEALQMPVYPDVLAHIQDLRDVIRSAFQVDPLGEVNTPVRSATEVSIRENRAQRTSATDISRLINELPKQIYEVSAKILAERRLLTKDRAIGQINTKRFRFDFQSPLFDLQKQDDLNHFITNLQIKQQFFGQGAAMATVDLPTANKFLTDKLNLPSKLFVTEEQLQKFIQAAAQQAQTAALPAPSTAAGKVNFPEQSQVQF
jgi:hypothetical protein